MLTSVVVRVVDFCRRFALWVLLVSLLASLGLGAFVVKTIKINTDIDQLLADDLDWRKAERELAAAFPQKNDRLVIVIDGANADLAEHAASKMAEALKAKSELFKSVSRPDSSPYFQKFGLLFLPETELAGILDVLVQAQPMLGSLANDPSLRGLFGTMGLATQGITRGDADYKAVEPSFAMIAQTLEAQMQDVPARLPWQSMMSDRPATLRDLRKFIVTQPVLDFSDLAPGSKARTFVRDTAAALELTEANGITVRMTGSVALNDEEFASVADGMELATLLSFAMVLGLLYMALRSPRLIYPILATLVVGLIATTAFALAVIGSLNLISVAFAVMFVGIAVDFGIQVGVRFRECRFECGDKDTAMSKAAQTIAQPLALATLMTAVGFMAFIPTDYRGVAELGIIASAGMIIAFILNLTLLPALLTLSNPPAEAESVGYDWAKPIDAFLEQHRPKLLIGIALLAVVSAAVASQVRFDFDPLNLKNPKAESTSTLFDIMKDPNATPYVVEILAPDLEAAKALAAKIEALPEVDHTITLASFVPKDQEMRLALINDTKTLLDTTLNPLSPRPAPNDAEIYETFVQTAAKLRALGEDKTAAQKLAGALDKIVAKQDHALLVRLDDAMITGMKQHLARVRTLLSGQAATLEDITPDLRADWMTADGRAKIEVYPKGDGRDHKVLTAFTDAVRSVAPEATGAPISIQESGKTVVDAFVRAGALALLAIALIGYAVLRRVTDVVRLILPLILAGILTLATMVMISLPLNFANIIALPLLLSLGVSYAIYFVTYWCDGHSRPLQSSTARAVLFSAATTLVAFGSLMLSSHPGTSGMGQLLTIALIYSGLSSFLALPVLLGRPRSDKPKLD